MGRKLSELKRAEIPEFKIQGVLERIIFHNEETGFTVAKIKEERKKELTSVVGNLIGVTPGETLELQGRWVYKKDYGEQFEVKEYKTIIPFQGDYRLRSQ